MGVPKFYRWISERYPCLSEVVKEYQIPEFDNLYLDMNGIIHNCSHPNDDDPHFRITEEKIFADIFHYIEVLFRMIQPRKVFFMAIDGVAPRAKMNQQRGRRFRSAKEAELNEKKARDRGETLPTEQRFDSNCITPGTPFMDRLHQQLKYMVANKISTDSLWKNVRVILSGHETPGEGEHKIMDFIRYQKSQPGYDTDTRHCLYGLDADLVMLGLCSHEPHFSLLREEVKFGGKKSQKSRTTTPEETTFHLLHLSLLREYLDFEFQELRSLPFYNLENVIDDWVLMGFLVGNDFLPNLPHMHINKGALPELYTAYKKILPQLNGYINEGGFLNLHRFEKFLEVLAENEAERFEGILSDEKWLEGKTVSKMDGVKKLTPTPGPGNAFALLEGRPEPGVNQAEPAKSVKSDLQRLMESTNEFDDSDDEKEEESLYVASVRQYKREYYISKLKCPEMTDEVLMEQAEGYVRAIQWNLHYYYNGCVSWSWFYPHHYAPWITDIKGFSRMKMNFDLSRPFLPFEQLLAVLPTASKELLPNCFQWLMTSIESPISDYFPLEFDLDLNGKQQDWEAVVLIPFIDEQRLLDAMKPFYPKLKPEEARRNSHGPMWSCVYSSESKGAYHAPNYFPPVELNHCEVEEIYREDWAVPVEKLRKGLMPGVRLGTFFPGFPTFQHIAVAAKLQKSQVKVFEQASRGENMILTLGDQGRPDIYEVARAIINQEIWVHWPHLVEAMVVAVSNNKVFIDDQCLKENRVKDSRSDFPNRCKDISEKYFSRFGVVIGETCILVHARQMTGRKFIIGQDGKKITLAKQWSEIQQAFPMQTVVREIPVELGDIKDSYTVEELFTADTTCFMLDRKFYGCQGKVSRILPGQKGRIEVNVEAPVEPNLCHLLQDARAVMSSQVASYQSGKRASQVLGMSSFVLSRITGTVYLTRGAKEQQMDTASKLNIGLNLKFNKRTEEVEGFTKKTHEGWTYSKRCIDVLNEYMEKFPEIFEFISGSTSSSNDIYFEQDIFPENTEEKTKEVAAWLESQPTATAPRQPFGTESLPKDVIQSIEACLDKAQAEINDNEVKHQVYPNELYLPNRFSGSSLPDPSTKFALFDRVVNVREGFSVPLGLKGIIIRIQKGNKPADNLYDVLFDRPFNGGLTLNSSPGRSYRLPGSALINISFGRNEQWSPFRGQHDKPKAIVRPHQKQGWNQDQTNAQQIQIMSRTGNSQPSRAGQSNQNKREEFRHAGGQINEPADGRALSEAPEPHNLPKPDFGKELVDKNRGGSRVAHTGPPQQQQPFPPLQIAKRGTSHDKAAAGSAAHETPDAGARTPTAHESLMDLFAGGAGGSKPGSHPANIKGRSPMKQGGGGGGGHMTGSDLMNLLGGGGQPGSHPANKKASKPQQDLLQNLWQCMEAPSKPATAIPPNAISVSDLESQMSPVGANSPLTENKFDLAESHREDMSAQLKQMLNISNQDKLLAGAAGQPPVASSEDQHNAKSILNELFSRDSPQKEKSGSAPMSLVPLQVTKRAHQTRESVERAIVRSEDPTSSVPEEMKSQGGAVAVAPEKSSNVGTGQEVGQPDVKVKSAKPKKDSASKPPKIRSRMAANFGANN